MFRKCFTGTDPTEGLDVLYLSGQINLNYYFHSSYDSFEKVCCKFEQSVCVPFVNSRGQVASLYKGRISISKNYRHFQVRITDLSVMDAGIYGCAVKRYPYSYQVVEVTVSGKI